MLMVDHGQQLAIEEELVASGAGSLNSLVVFFGKISDLGGRLENGLEAIGEPPPLAINRLGSTLGFRVGRESFREISISSEIDLSHVDLNCRWSILHCPQPYKLR